MCARQVSAVLRGMRQPDSYGELDRRTICQTRRSFLRLSFRPLPMREHIAAFEQGMCAILVSVD